MNDLSKNSDLIRKSLSNSPEKYRHFNRDSILKKNVASNLNQVDLKL